MRKHIGDYTQKKEGTSKVDIPSERKKEKATIHKETENLQVSALVPDIKEEKSP